MLDDQIEERFDGLEKKLEELSAEVKELKKQRDEEPTLIPEAEYDFVPSVPEKVIARGVVKFVRIVEAPNDLGLSPSEWAQFSDDDSACDEPVIVPKQGDSAGSPSSTT